jgi:hypothetical protein
MALDIGAMSTMQTRQSSIRKRALGMLVLLLASCAGGGAMLTGVSDWSTLYRGQGTVDTRVLNDSGESITVRILGESDDKILAQAPLGSHESATLSLRTGSVRATVRVIRDGRAAYSDPQTFQVDHAGAEWHFTPPSIE